MNIFSPDSVLLFYSDWPPENILAALFITAVIFLIQEIIIAAAIRRRKKTGQESLPEGKKGVFPSWLLQITGTALRFLIPYIFIKIIERPGGPVFPWNLAFHTPSLLLLFGGILSVFYKAISLLEKLKFGDFPDTTLKKQLLTVSRRNLKTILLIIIFSLFFWSIIELFPEKTRASGIVTSIIIANMVLFITILLLLVQQFFNSAEKLYTHEDGKTALIILIKSLSTPVRIIILAMALVWLRILIRDTGSFSAITGKLINFLFLAAVIVFVYRAGEYLGARISSLSDDNTNSLDKTQVEMIRMIIRIIIITAGVFAAIRIFTGKPIPTLLAGLGIGGLAVALAAQDTLKNFFGSIMIMSDKPFKIGERIQTEGYDGVIEAIGFRSTRMRTLTGHQVIIPNDKMAISTIENIGRRPNIRRLTNITVTYDTSPEKMEQALSIIRGILDNHEGMQPDLPARVFFSEFNADSLNILVIYWYSPPEYWKYMEFSEKVNLTIMKEFNREGIKFAFPSTTTYLEQPEGMSLKLDLGPQWKK